MSYTSTHYMKYISLQHDIESNPGPKKKKAATLNLSVQTFKASHHQGNAIYGQTAGFQCSCNALASLVILKQCTNYSNVELNDVLQNLSHTI